MPTSGKAILTLIQVKKLVEKEEDLEVLRKWHKLAARVNSIDEVANIVRLN